MSTILRSNNPQLFDMNNRTKSIYWLICNNVKNGGLGLSHTKDLPDTAYAASMVEYDRQCNLLSAIQSTVESSYINSSFSSPNALNDNDESANPSLSQEDRARSKLPNHIRFWLSTIERLYNYGSEDQFRIPLDGIFKEIRILQQKKEKDWFGVQKFLSEKIMKSDRIDWETKLPDRELAW
jgi:hypothetical protein